jgi:short-subunit dehydrogenase
VGRNSARLAAVADDLRTRGGPQCVVTCIEADLGVLAQYEALFDEAEQSLGGIDAILVAHGVLPDQAKCQTDVREALAQVAINGLSPVSLCTIAANRFEAKGSGCIAVITSVAGDRGRQSNYVYGAAKGLVSRFLEGLRNRLAPKGIAVVDIRPGFVDTPMTAAIDPKGPLWAQPAQVGHGIVRAMAGGRDIVYLPGFWRLIMFVIRSVPESIFKRLKL